MTGQSADFLAELAEDVRRWDASRARSQQLTPGASGTYQCRASLVLRAIGIPESDPHLSWQAVVGTAIHRVFEEARDGDGRYNEHKLTYRGVPCTIDEIDTPVLRDYKSKDTAAEIASVRRDGPKRGQVAQVMLGAAAAREAGHEITTVQLVYVPRAGDLADGWVWSAPFDPTLADAAADWHEQVRGLIAEREGFDAVDAADGLRDSPPSFCYAFCPFATACRGERPESLPVDAEVEAAAADYVEAKALEAEAAERAAKARAFLANYTDLRAVGLQWSGGRSKTVEEDDLETARFLLGDRWPVRLVEKTTARTLRRVK